jgi:guanosine-diphosphatase
MIDAGSTGSRIHIYKFNNCGASPTYEYEVFKMTQPGLSSYNGQPSAAAESLDVLMNEAVRVVPESLRSCTPVAVKATAGLRLLGASQSVEILQAVERRLRDHYPFPLLEKDGVVIMEGKDEGVYAWITANYLLNTIRADTPLNTPSYAVLDLGGASTQIVFEPQFSKPDSSLVEGEHKYDLQFAAKMHVLYQHSYLGYGLMSARKSVHRLVDFMASIRPSTTAEAPIGNPCIAKGMERIVEVKDEMSGTAKNVTMIGEEVGGFEACDRIMQLVMAKDTICEVKPCSFNGVYQPSLLDTFPAGKVLLLSYFYDRLQPLLSKKSPRRITVSTFATLAKDVCNGKSSWTKKWGNNKDAMAELEGRPEYCLDLTFMHALLRLGYEFADDREVTIGKQIEGTELGWCLGATIATMVGGELKCRI